MSTSEVADNRLGFRTGRAGQEVGAEHLLVQPEAREQALDQRQLLRGRNFQAMRQLQRQAEV